MKLAELEKFACTDDKFSPIHQVAGDVGVELVLRDAQSLEYAAAETQAYRIAVKAGVKAEQNSHLCTAVAAIKSWNLTDGDKELPCTVEYLFNFLQSPTGAWIATQVFNEVWKKKAHIIKTLNSLSNT